ncbi:hypothetical protein Ancab_024959 [Ancistrocladus abbreviatus]
MERIVRFFRRRKGWWLAVYDPQFSGFVQIADTGSGKVGFAVEESSRKFDAFFVGLVEHIPNNISVIQLNKIMYLPPAEPAGRQLNLTSVMSGHGCKLFAEELSAVYDPQFSGFVQTADTGGGKVGFAIEESSRKFDAFFIGSVEHIPNNISVIQLNKIMPAAKFDFYHVWACGEQVILRTGVARATITRTLFHEIPAVIFAIDKFLLPKEWFMLAVPTSILAADKMEEDGGRSIIDRVLRSSFFSAAGGSMINRVLGFLHGLAALMG